MLLLTSHCVDASEVMTRHTQKPLRLFGVSLTVRPLEMEVPAVSCAVEVTGFAADANEDLLVMFFENRRRSGGETTEDFFYDVDNRRAVITYKTVEGSSLYCTI